MYEAVMHDKIRDAEGRHPKPRRDAEMSAQRGWSFKAIHDQSRRKQRVKHREDIVQLKPTFMLLMV
jgi:hypothetical protein